MKAGTLKLCLPAIAITVQNNAASLIIPPFLQELQFPVAMIGSLMSLGPVLALASRIPTGVAYNRSRARLLLSVAIFTMAACNFLYSYIDDAMSFALVHGMNGFAYGADRFGYDITFYVAALLAPFRVRSNCVNQSFHAATPQGRKGASRSRWICPFSQGRVGAQGGRSRSRCAVLEYAAPDRKRVSPLVRALDRVDFDSGGSNSASLLALQRCDASP
jgi:hypothetical protein